MSTHYSPIYQKLDNTPVFCTCKCI